MVLKPLQPPAWSQQPLPPPGALLGRLANHPQQPSSRDKPLLSGSRLCPGGTRKRHKGPACPLHCPLPPGPHFLAASWAMILSLENAPVCTEWELLLLSLFRTRCPNQEQAYHR